jgi:hypothetical protein
MSRKPFTAVLTLAVLSLAVWGCADQGPTDPGNQPVPSFARASTVSGYGSATDPDLLAWYNSEKARVASQAALEEPVYASLLTTAGDYDRWMKRALRNGVAECYPNAYAADVQIIGPEGGQLTIGAHTFTVPPNDLSKYYVITGEDHADDKAAVQFGPEGLGFAKPALVKLNYSKCAILASATKQVVFTDDRWNIKEYEPSTDDVLNQILGGYLVHFSQYAVAW